MPKLANSSVKRARMTVPADAVIDSPTRATARATASCRLEARAEAFPDPEDEEQPVVGPRPEDEDDEEQLGDLGDLEPVGAELADERARQLQDDRRRQQRDEAARAASGRRTAGAR